MGVYIHIDHQERFRHTVLGDRLHVDLQDACFKPTVLRQRRPRPRQEHKSNLEILGDLRLRPYVNRAREVEETFASKMLAEES